MRSMGGATDEPLFAATTTVNPSQVQANNPTNTYRDSSRNPSAKYEPMTRLASMATTRSNVYAVWVTIGFFEVEPAQDLNTFNTQNGVTPLTSTTLYYRVYPDGYQLGREAGLDTGDNRRLRGFYIIDRSMPAGFEPGSDLNVENTIRLKRRIQ
jgi:hypothetical protein